MPPARIPDPLQLAPHELAQRSPGFGTVTARVLQHPGASVSVVSIVHRSAPSPDVTRITQEHSQCPSLPPTEKFCRKSRGVLQP